MTTEEINNAIESFETAVIFATIKYVQALHFGFKADPHMEAITKFNNYAFILKEGSNCDCIDTFEIICEVEKISNKYMANCDDKITEEQARNLISLLLSQQLSSLEDAIGSCLDKTLVNPTICNLITTAQNTADSAQTDLDALEAKDPRGVVSNDDTLSVDGTSSSEYDVTIDINTGETSDSGVEEPGYTLDVTDPTVTPGQWQIDFSAHSMPYQLLATYGTGASQNGANPAGVKATPFGTLVTQGQIDLTSFDFDFTVVISPSSVISDWMSLGTIPTSFSPSGGGSISLVPSKNTFVPVIVEADALVQTNSPFAINPTLIPCTLRINASGEIHIRTAPSAVAEASSGNNVESSLGTNTSGKLEVTGRVYLDGITYKQ